MVVGGDFREEEGEYGVVRRGSLGINFWSVITLFISVSVVWFFFSCVVFELGVYIY